MLQEVFQEVYGMERHDESFYMLREKLAKFERLSTRSILHGNFVQDTRERVIKQHGQFVKEHEQFLKSMEQKRK